MMSPGQEVWAIERWKGRDGPRYIAEQSGALVLQQDRHGAEHWQAVATAFDQLTTDQVTQ